MGKKKSSYFKNKKPGGISIPPKGSHGILVTCDIRFVNKAVDQVMKFLNSIVDPLPTTEEENSNVVEEPQKELSLEEELAQLKNPNKKSGDNQPKKKPRFTTYISEVNGNFFIRFTQDIDDPFVILDKYFEMVKEAGESQTPRVTRLYPIQASGFPSTEESIPVITQLIKDYFKPDHPVKYEVAIERKHKGNGQNETHDELNQKIVSIVGQPHKPSYHEGDVGVLWLSLGRNLYMSVIPKWKEWCGCNVPKFAAKCVQKNDAEKEDAGNEKEKESK